MNIIGEYIDREIAAGRVPEFIDVFLPLFITTSLLTVGFCYGLHKFFHD
jgi:hypothetical protein